MRKNAERVPARYTYDYVLALLLAGGASRDEAERIAREVAPESVPLTAAA